MKQAAIYLAIIISLGILPNVAHSSSYSMAVEKQRLCRVLGSMGSSVYEGKELGRTEVDLRQGLQHIADGSAPDLTIKRVYASARSSREAYMIGWAACMDD